MEKYPYVTYVQLEWNEAAGFVQNSRDLPWFMAMKLWANIFVNREMNGHSLFLEKSRWSKGVRGR